ncbi:SpaA isopeptide-forming pilin-related protein [Carnobacterium divergens]|uniref:MSCRAMM family protein n=1 Tax=Carnobacterium divergens TaxID=2748 RepID=UPI00288FBA3B|nr:SpaA isopeptide-forming pilin-related protein [Carnobacterium divergens]MDT1957201.1 SpaA isopeptide-forming pilin-related protein [Carnobacterium divergens]
MKKIVAYLTLFLMLLSPVASFDEIVFSEELQPRTPNLSFQVTPDPIGSMELVSLNVNIDSSFNELPNPAKICFDVPSILVRQSSDFKNQELPDYLTWLNTKDDGTITHICYQIDTAGQQYFSFSIQFTSALLMEGAVEPRYDITATLDEVATVTDTVSTKPSNTGNPHFAKFRKFATDPIDGLGLLDLNFPNYNTYELVFNRDFSNDFQNVKIQDQLATGTKLNASFPGWSEIPGNRVSINGLRIYQVDETIPPDQENRKYVTEQFVDKIIYNEESGRFDVNLGDVPKNISYIVQYAVEVSDGTLGTYTNSATLTRDLDVSITKTSTEKIKSNGSGKGFFEKGVDKKELTLPDRLITYQLKVGGEGYTLPAGTIFFDYLPEGVVFKGLKSNVNDTFELVSIEDNKVTFKTTKELVNYTEDLLFETEYISDVFPINLNNTAYIQKDTGTYYSNTVSTNIEGNHSVILTKKEEGNGNVLKNAHFDLYNSSGMVIKKDLTTNQEGQIVVEDLALGSYQFIETVAPNGYILDETPISFEITDSQQEPIQVSKINKKILGNVLLTKTAETSDGKKLEGAIFKLQDSNGTLLKENLVTNSEGELFVDGLQPGSYQFIETVAPNGYILDETPISFEITDSQQEPIQVSKINKKILGNVLLTKTAETNDGKKLEGAIFKLQDSNGTLLKENLVTNSEGELFVDGLLPGSYQFIETKAPDGYKLDINPVEFTINGDMEETVMVNKTNSLLSKVPEEEPHTESLPNQDLPTDKNDFDNTNSLPLLGESVQSIASFLGLSILFIIGMLLSIRKKRKN